MSENSLISTPTIMYMAALALIGLIPLIPVSFSNAKADVALNLLLSSTKKDSGVFSNIAGKA